MTKEKRHARASYRFRPATQDDDEFTISGDFVTDSEYLVDVTPDGFTLRLSTLPEPVRKAFPDDDDASCDEGQRFLALHGDRPCGYIDLLFEAWNARLVVVDIEVEAGHRRRGVGRELLAIALERAHQQGASHLWLEVTSLNVPAIRTYQEAGFAFCGLDTSLYQSTESAGEIALFMSRPVP